jgi:hypothetical protein
MTDKPDNSTEAVEPWDGRPQNPEQEDVHWLRYERDGYVEVSAFQWERDGWWVKSRHVHRSEWVGRWTYLGPCTTPAENDALRAEVASILAENDALRFTLNNANAALRQAVERARGEALEEAARWHADQAIAYEEAAKVPVPGYPDVTGDLARWHWTAAHFIRALGEASDAG